MVLGLGLSRINYEGYLAGIEMNNEDEMNVMGGGAGLILLMSRV